MPQTVLAQFDAPQGEKIQAIAQGVQEKLPSTLKNYKGQFKFFLAKSEPPLILLMKEQIGNKHN